jgi:outer membrane lipoprotein-sorting protein
MRSVWSQRGRAGSSGRWIAVPAGCATALLAAAIATSPTARASAPADLFDDIYRKGQPLEQSIRTIRARFTETTTSSLLVKPVVAEGTLLAVRPSDILLSYTRPEKKLLRIDATTLRFVWPDRKLHETRDIRESQARVQKYFVDKTPAELRRHFAITAAEDTARPGTWRLEMLPKRKQIQQGVTKIELWIDQRTSMLSTMTLTFAGGDTKTMSFTDVEVNAPITLADLGLPSAG